MIVIALHPPLLRLCTYTTKLSHFSHQQHCAPLARSAFLQRNCSPSPNCSVLVLSVASFLSGYDEVELEPAQRRRQHEPDAAADSGVSAELLQRLAP